MSFRYKGNIVLDMHINFDGKYPTLKMISLDTNTKEEIHTHFNVFSVKAEEYIDCDIFNIQPNEYISLDTNDTMMNLSFNNIAPFFEERHKL